MILSAHSSPSRGTMLDVKVIQPRHIIVYSNLRFRALEPTKLTVVGEGNVDCFITTMKNVPIAADYGDGNECNITIVPDEENDYKLFIVNREETSTKTTIMIQ